MQINTSVRITQYVGYNGVTWTYDVHDKPRTKDILV